MIHRTIFKHMKSNTVAQEIDDAGFTILELLVVLSIVALLGALVGPRVLQYLSKAKTETAQAQINNLSTAVELFRLDVGAYPSQQAGLSSLHKAPTDAKNWNGPYLKNKNGLLDPWGQAFQYRLPGTQSDFDIFSFGRDNAEGGDGEDQDLTN